MSGADLASRLAFVSGGASGIGRALAAAVVAKGGRVAIGDVDLDRARAVADSLGSAACAYACDVRDHAAVVALAAAIAAERGPVDIAFANAGIGLSGPVLDADPAAVDRIQAVNLKGVWSVAAAFGRPMVARRSGHLCLTASEHAFGLAHLGSGLYTATKHAVLGLADAIRAELPPGVGISVLCPGLVSTDFYDAGRYEAERGDDPGLAFRRAVLAQGVDPADIATKALAGIARGDFLIPTHGHSKAIADRRHAEISAAFAVHAPMTDDAERYDVNRVVADLIAKRRAGAAE